MSSIFNFGEKDQPLSLKESFYTKRNKGFTLFFAVITTATLILVATGVINLAYRQSTISGSARDSQLAFHAADTGMECALYWDVRNPAGDSAFNVASSSIIYCNKDINNPGNQWTVGNAQTSVIDRINFLPDLHCAVVTITKNGDDTVIESKGYNTCDPASTRRVERAIRATY